MHLKPANYHELKNHSPFEMAEKHVILLIQIVMLLFMKEDTVLILIYFTCKRVMSKYRLHKDVPDILFPASPGKSEAMQRLSGGSHSSPFIETALNLHLKPANYHELINHSPFEMAEKHVTLADTNSDAFIHERRHRPNTDLFHV